MFGKPHQGSNPSIPMIEQKMFATKGKNVHPMIYNYIKESGHTVLKHKEQKANFLKTGKMELIQNKVTLKFFA